MSDQTVAAPQEVDRRRFIGGSDIAAILGLSAFRTPLDVYYSKIAEKPEWMDPEKKKFLERRKRWEPVVFQMLREEMDAKIVSTNLRYADADYPHFASEIDFEFEDPTTGEICNGEVKTVHPRAFGERYGWGEGGTGDVPIDYDAQVQWGLGIKRRKKALLVALVGIDQMVFYPIDAAPVEIAKMREVGDLFWHANVLARKEPDPKTISDLHRLYKVSKPELSIPADDPLASKALALRGVRAQIAALGLTAEALEFDVKLGMKDAEILTVDGRKIFTWAGQNWSDLDEALLKEKFPEAYRACTIGSQKKNPETGQPWPKRRVFKHLSST